jgi:hypothetical protein
MITGIIFGVIILVIVLAVHSFVDDMKKSDEYKCPIDNEVDK